MRKYRSSGSGASNGSSDTQRTSFDCGVGALQRFARQRGGSSQSLRLETSSAISWAEVGIPTRLILPKSFLHHAVQARDYVPQSRAFLGRCDTRREAAVSVAEERHARGAPAFRHRRFKRDRWEPAMLAYIYAERRKHRRQQEGTVNDLMESPCVPEPIGDDCPVRCLCRLMRPPGAKPHFSDVGWTDIGRWDYVDREPDFDGPRLQAELIMVLPGGRRLPSRSKMATSMCFSENWMPLQGSFASAARQGRQDRRQDEKHPAYPS